ncbi:unnamed protein product [Orchesella dallaii]|uniref:Ionotropic glutamate receptor C-terminal domain-containing protein n=1 Tax=Orchesella dallaii TaxID=48710 RepID=A0ABP1RYN4_9HEXA
MKHINEPLPLKSTLTNIPNLVSNLFPSCKLVAIHGNFGNEIESTKWKKLKLHHDILSNPNVVSYSAGVTSLELKDKNGNNDTKYITVRRLPRTFTNNCHVVIITLPVGLPNPRAQSIINSRLNLPLLHPTTFRNLDKYFLLTESTQVSSLFGMKVIQKLKFKLIIAQDRNSKVNHVKLYQFFAYCPIKEISFNLEDTLPDFEYFPDFQRNFFGSVLKVSATDKLGGLLEIEIDPVSGRNIAKRGVYALALSHLQSGLNFSYELYRSSGGGSTGHPLSNGTWLGTVGDVYNGKVDFGLVCGMTYIRHFVIELCATITYEYISFAIGPSTKLFTWKAIFWPFNGELWCAMFVSTIFTIVCAYVILKYQFSPEENVYQKSKWDIFTVAQYFGRTFIEQADELPNTGLSQSLKIIMGFWLLFALIGATVYRAKMVGFMTFPIFEPSPTTFDELDKSHFKIQFHYFGNVAYNTFKTSTSSTFMSIFGKMSKQPDPFKCLENTVKSSRTACILFGCVYEELKNRNFSDKFGQSPIKMSPNYGFMYTPGVLHEKKADFSENFKWILSNAMQMGLNERWEKSDFLNLLKLKNTWVKELSPGDRRKIFHYDFEVSNDVLHLKHFKGAFSVLIAGWLTAALSFTCENLRKKELESNKFKFKSITQMLIITSWVRNENAVNELEMQIY